jgi:hypothetical protein
MAWRTIRAAANITSMRVHDLRHNYAATGVSHGVDLRIVGQLLRHKDIDSTLVYAHLATDALIASATRVSAVIDRSLTARSASAAPSIIGLPVVAMGADTDGVMQKGAAQPCPTVA